MQSNISPNQLLGTIQAELRRTSDVSALSSKRFDQSHELFERSSNQQSLIRTWLTDLVHKHHARREPLKILSVGCGSGILDNPLIELIAELSIRIEYTGVDPNKVACRRFRDEFNSLRLANVRLELLEQDIETLESGQQFDLIHAVHSLYYFDNPAATIDALQKLQAPDGHLVIIQAPNAELNQMSNCFWQQHLANDIWFSDCLADHLAQRGLDYSRQRIHGEVEVTRCFETGCSRGEMLLNFITQCDSSFFNDDILRLCRGYLRSISHKKEESLFVDHPADAFVIAQDI